jgi:putative glutamine amidotransferase
MTRNLTIGITTRKGDDAWVRENTQNYINVLQSYGVTPVILSPDTPVTLPDGTRYAPDALGRLPAEVLARLDGLVLAGGGDVHPKYFGAELAGANPDAIDLKRDELELALARQAYAADLPTFGICRGCQVMNVAAGGGMVQDFDGHRSPKDAPVLHDVTLEAGSRLEAIIGRSRLPVNTYHHQGLDRPSMAPLFAATGVADPDTWLVEAFESPDHRWVIGVQWHPERLFELDDAHRRLWDSFVAACQGQD